MAIPGTGNLLSSRYRLHEQIAVGGTGEVWRAADAALGRAVAVKLLRPEYAGHAETLARFRAEARHAAQLIHPGIVQVYDYSQDPADLPFLVMELVDGPSLASVLAGGPLHPSWVLNMIGQVAAGLAAAHAAGLVHRDIKPANLLLAPDSTVKITDFGIASAAGAAPLTQAGMLACTPAYLAPERATGSAASPASDLYSLGVVAWECLAGMRPFTGTPLEVALSHAYRDLPPLPAGVPAGVAGLVAELTAKDPAARPTAAAVAAARARQPRATVTVSAARPAGRPAAGHQDRALTTLALAGITAHGAPSPGRRMRRSRTWPGRTALRAAAGATVVAAGLAIVLTDQAPATTPQPRPAAASAAPAARMITIDGTALAGQPAAAVLAQLRRAGLRPRLVQLPESRQQPGTVITVQPAGQLPADTTVTVTEAVQPPDHRHQHHNSDGNGN